MLHEATGNTSRMWENGEIVPSPDMLSCERIDVAMVRAEVRWEFWAVNS